MKIINVDDIEWQKGVFVNPNTEEPLPIIHKIATIEMLRDWQEEVKAIPLEKVKQARQDIAELDGKYEQIYYGTYYENKMDSDKYVRIAEVLDILDKLIESEVING